MIAYLIIFIIVLFVGMIIFYYNRLVKYKNRMQEAWSGIDVCLKKRYDLVPRLVETVKGYVRHEQDTLKDVTRYRTEAMHATNAQDRMQMEDNLGKALGRFVVAVESYPELKANSNFQQLMQQLSELENDLEMSRRYYNGTVRENNISIESFPSNIVAGMFNFSKGDFFDIEPAHRENPNISFE